MAKKSTRFALAATASLAALSMGAATAQADIGDAAVANDSPVFRLNKWTLEPGEFRITAATSSEGGLTAPFTLR